MQGSARRQLNLFIETSFLPGSVDVPGHHLILGLVRNQSPFQCILHLSTQLIVGHRRIECPSGIFTMCFLYPNAVDCAAFVTSCNKIVK